MSEPRAETRSTLWQIRMDKLCRANSVIQEAEELEAKAFVKRQCATILRGQAAELKLAAEELGRLDKANLF